jgi:hypothetical protein
MHDVCLYKGHSQPAVLLRHDEATDAEFGDDPVVQASGNPAGLAAADRSAADGN